MERLLGEGSGLRSVRLIHMNVLYLERRLEIILNIPEFLFS